MNGAVSVLEAPQSASSSYRQQCRIIEGYNLIVATCQNNYAIDRGVDVAAGS